MNTTSPNDITTLTTQIGTEPISSSLSSYSRYPQQARSSHLRCDSPIPPAAPRSCVSNNRYLAACSLAGCSTTSALPLPPSTSVWSARHGNLPSLTLLGASPLVEQCSQSFYCCCTSAVGHRYVRLVTSPSRHVASTHDKRGVPRRTGAIEGGGNLATWPIPRTNAGCRCPDYPMGRLS
jgi:hypothetical protein